MISSVPGAKPPEMAAVTPPPALSTAPIVPQALVRKEPTPVPAATAAAIAPLPTAEPAPARAVRTAAVGCEGDPIKCMLDGRNHRPDPLETTGSIVPKKPAPKVAPKPVPRPQP